MPAVPKDVNVSPFNSADTGSATGSQGFPRSSRLSDAGVISKTLAQKPLKKTHLALHSHQGSHVGLALAIPKKLARRAVDRNRIKRLIREAYRTQPEEKKQLWGSVVVRLHKRIGLMKNRLLKKQEKDMALEVRQAFDAKKNP
jgi:ribonuclease P protein component